MIQICVSVIVAVFFLMLLLWSVRQGEKSQTGAAIKRLQERSDSPPPEKTRSLWPAPGAPELDL